MKHLAVAIGMLLTINISSSSQNMLIDSLQVIVERANENEKEVEALNELSFQFKNSSPEEALDLAKKGYALAQKLGFKKGMADSQVMFGILSKNNGEYAASTDHYLNALALRKELALQEGIASCYNNLGNVAKSRGLFDEAKDYFEDGINAIKEAEYPNIEAKLRNNLASIYRHLGDYKKALEEVNKSIELRKLEHGQKGLAASLLNLGNVYHGLYAEKKAIEAYEKSLEIYESNGDFTGKAKCLVGLGAAHHALGNDVNSLQFYSVALEIKDYLNVHDLALTHRNIGGSLKRLGKFDQSLYHFRESLQAFSAIGNAEEMATATYNIGTLFMAKNLMDSASAYFLKCIPLADTISDPFVRSQLLYNLSESYAHIGNFEEALKASQQYNFLRDSLHESFIEASNYRMQLEEEQNSGNRKSMIIKGLAIGSFLLVLLCGAMAIAFRNHHKRRKADEKVQLAYNEIDELLRKQERQTNYARLEGQDLERKRIAKDLHDRLGSMLSTIKLYFDHFDSKMTQAMDENKKQYDKATELLDEACEEVRKIAHNMQSGILSKFGLTAELETLAQTIKDSNRIDVEISTHGLEERLDTITEVKIYRIIQELVSNILKHAHATRFSIQVNRFSDLLNILVEDNGTGFNPENKFHKGGMGLNNVKSRVFDLHGNLHIDSAKGRGSTITIDIPCSGFMNQN